MYTIQLQKDTSFEQYQRALNVLEEMNIKVAIPKEKQTKSNSIISDKDLANGISGTELKKRVFKHIDTVFSV